MGNVPHSLMTATAKASVRFWRSSGVTMPKAQCTDAAAATLLESLNELNHQSIPSVSHSQISQHSSIVSIANPSILTSDPQIDHFDEDRETDSEVDVAARDVLAEAVSDERQADQQQEAEREHLHRRMLLDEMGDALGRKQHREDGDDDRRD